MNPTRKAKWPPKDGVSPELLELVSKWLRTTYGSRPLRHFLMYRLEHNLGDLEREWCKDEPKDTALEM